MGDVPLSGLSKRDLPAMLDAFAAEKSAETARKALTALRVAELNELFGSVQRARADAPPRLRPPK